MPSPLSHITKLSAKVVMGFLLGAAVSSGTFAVQPTNGFFTGVNLDPLANASIATVETEPAVVLMFASDQKTADITRQFEEWYQAVSPAPGLAVYAIAVAPGDQSRDLVAEAITQRDMTMPVYLSRVDMLLGDDFRLLVLNNDAEVQRFATLDFAGLRTTLSSLGVTVADFAAPAATGSVTNQSVQSSSDVLSDGSSVSTITTTTETPSRIAGATSDEALYVNKIYGFQVEFPPAWRYRVAARDDGAVAADRPGSRMDMRVWAEPADGIALPQEFIDQRLETIARTNRTRVNVERRLIIRDGGLEGIEVSYMYTKAIDEDRPAMGVMLHRGRLQVFVSNGNVIAASVEAPAGEFAAMMSIIEPFLRSFEVLPSNSSDQPQYDSPTI